MSQLNISRRAIIKGALLTAATIPVAVRAMTNIDQREMVTTIVPASLEKGDTIGFFSPSTPATSFALKRFARAKLFLEGKGFKLQAGSLTGQSDHYRSGSIKARAEELNALIKDPKVRCIMATMGGMVSNSMLPYIDYQALKNDPKIIIGYSDVTALLFGIYAQTGIITYYGPALVSSFGEIGYFLEQTYQYFYDMVEKPSLPYTIKNPDFWTEDYVDWQAQTAEKNKTANKLLTINTGKATGRLIAGNLNTIQGIFASRYMPDINQGDILLIEDSFKDAATVERSFSHFKINGIFDRIGGLILGKHEKFDDQGTGRKPYEILMEVIDQPNMPILAEYDCCHTHPMITLPIGAIATLDADKQTITIESI
jgi:muramoyltetrapeptide carboxypeptidase